MRVVSMRAMYHSAMLLRHWQSTAHEVRVPASPEIEDAREVQSTPIEGSPPLGLEWRPPGGKGPKTLACNSM
eukprot:scaffold60972_cov68-Phaeocystis_antarctica.AAC.2